ncbi:MAG TPA: 1,6-anhydro-N-acetylmuramyl-L-alanine amidase AmpD [Ideonella sp.]|uniref:1,6-anhydro-N-acetylmuramyl-L-alanine amidase AmpD n=1 Tax=Ideonella sp. TaxID=1929293 RepID=UPI002E315C6E|nr:1,6-anhydro-N-acetylmuramyl-L-alanine amidase AmpD [Ideonella sp.]HEX5686366.1 1,6-anhydro-N-acetylmuramyl-L-alanine amidase AmpD [Ideonella sp.]
MSWVDGWWSGARAIVSPNFGPRPAPAEVSLVVLHSISLPPGTYGGDAVEQLFTNRLDPDAHPAFAELRGLQVSAHFFLRRDGRLQQFVSCDQRAWHAGVSRWRGRDNCNDYSIGIELEGLEGDRFEAAQYERLVTLLRVLQKRYGRFDVAGHEHVAPARKRDPGPGFDWAGLIGRLGWRADRFPAPPT